MKTLIFIVSKAFEEVREILSAGGSEIKHEYNIGTFRGFSATLSERLCVCVIMCTALCVFYVYN